MSDNDQQPRRDTGTTWTERWGRSIAIAALPLAFVVGTFFRTLGRITPTASKLISPRVREGSKKQ
jgi:hypothetical protein